MSKRTFSIGGIHPHDNKISRECAIETLPVPPVVYVSVSQHIGAPAKPVVAVGDKVKAGQVVAEPGGFVSAFIHSPVSGTVKSIGPRKDIAGNNQNTIEIAVEGDEWIGGVDLSSEIVSGFTDDNSVIMDKIRKGGIVGLGGATFPTQVKLAPPPGKKCEMLIINGCECEPYLTCDHQLMLEHGEEIIVGIQIVMKALGINRAIIGIEKNKPDAIENMRRLSSHTLGITVQPLNLRYPQGGEKQLIDACIRRQVPSGALPIEVGAVVDNVATLYAIYEAVQKNKPLISRVMTITGKSVLKPGNYSVRFGTPLSEVLEAAGGLPASTSKIIGGGPMMGRAMNNIDMPTNKRVSGMLLLDEDESRRGKVENCIRCGKCVSACPMGLEPYLLSKFSELERWEDMEKHSVMDCIDCGCCQFTCPSNRPLLDYIRSGKGTVGGIIRARAAAK
mgnify:CR=1 FL=1